MPDPDDRIWIVEACVVYDRSRKWLEDQIAAGLLHVPPNTPGDRRKYLLRSELDALLRPQMTKRDSEQS